MRIVIRQSTLLPAFLFLLCGSAAMAEPLDPALLDWRVEILIDNQFPAGVDPPFGQSQLFGPRDNRGLAISPDGRFLYAGYNNNESDFPNLGETRRIDLTTGLTAFDPAGNSVPFDQQVKGLRGKALATDDVGRVYFAEGSRSGAAPEIVVLNSQIDENSPIFSINNGSAPEGIAVTREGVGPSEQLVMYTSDRGGGTLSKWIIAEGPGDSILSITADPTFGTAGTLNLPGAQNLRNVEIDGDGNVWVAGFGNDTLYRVTPDGTVIDSASIVNPFDIGFNGDQVLVTTLTDRVINLFDIADFESDAITANAAQIVPPWLELALDPDGNDESGDEGALSGIVVVPGVGFFVTNELGQTLGNQSIFGGGDLLTDDNDPILYATLIPEPGAVVLALMALAAFAALARRQRAGKTA